MRNSGAITSQSQSSSGSVLQGGTSYPIPESGYSRAPAGYDEMLGQGGVFPHWQRFVQTVHQFSENQLETLIRNTHLQLRENGVTYNVHGDGQGMSRPWQLDPVPLLVEMADWKRIERGLRQRATLMNLLMRDIYGPRKLMAEGVLPAELVYAHAGFLRPCDQIDQPSTQQLFTYAADLSRGPDRRWWVVNDRTQAPSGSGYALENRIVMARALPGLFRDCRVRRLAGYFSEMRNQLASRAPRPTDNPRVVVLTPGPYAETYFEHAYLAYYLGFTLVQGDDLTVRDGRVWLKTLGGLQQVDVILRRLDQGFCDPLELNPDSRLGIPGLLDAVRRGNVAVVNPIGSGVLENPGLMAFLPSICRTLLGEELELPSAATWWCGQEKERQYVLENISKLVIKRIHRQPDFATRLGPDLSKTEIADLRKEIEASPHMFIGQEIVSFSTAPFLVENRLEPRNTVLRCFLCASDDSFAVMPGGLTRVASDADNFIVSNRTGGYGKDTWICGQGQEDHRSLLPLAREQHRNFSRNSLTSRAAENLFWAGRYSERAEGSARLIRAILRAWFEQESSGDALSRSVLDVLLAAITRMSDTPPGFIGDEGAAARENPEEELHSLLFDDQRAGTLAYNLGSLQGSAVAVRDLWSNDSWRVLSAIRSNWSEEAHQKTVVLGLRSHLDELITSLVAFGGLNVESMPREAGWTLLDTGRRIERAVVLIDILRSCLGQRMEDNIAFMVHEALLSVTECLATHRHRYRSQTDIRDILDLLLHDEAHPRSLLYQIQRIQRNVGQLPREEKFRMSEEEKLVLDILARLQLANLDELAIPDQMGHRIRLEVFLKGLSDSLTDVSESLTRTYFTHTWWQQMVQSSPPPLFT